VSDLRQENGNAQFYALCKERIVSAVSNGKINKAMNDAESPEAGFTDTAPESRTDVIADGDPPLHADGSVGEATGRIPLLGFPSCRFHFEFKPSMI
jgi:hypothetical protein